MRVCIPPIHTYDSSYRPARTRINIDRQQPAWSHSSSCCLAMAPASPHGYSDAEASASLITVPEKRGIGLNTLLAYIGPGFMIAIGFIDPGNFETDLQAGAVYQYSLLWIVLLASIAALLMQSLAANLGTVTGKHLAEHCKEEYSRRVSFCLWIAAELAIVACDIPEVLGTAFALNLLFHLPLWAGVLLTGLSTLMLLALQQYGVRKLEIVIAFLIFTMASCFFAELSNAKPQALEVVKGMFVPQLNGNGATGLAISLIGAMVMPHNLFLHSALVLSRKTPRTVQGLKDGCRFYLIELTFAICIAFTINLSITAVSGAICFSPNLSPENKNNCANLDLNQASFLLQNVLGRWSSKLFGIALLASGQSSTITGTYAGQYVMQGFLNIRLVPWLRNLLTRTVAITPSLIAALVGGSSASGRLIIISSMILTFELPFALIPLIKFTNSKSKMNGLQNHLVMAIISWALACGIMMMNMYYLTTGLYYWLVSNNGLPKVGVAFVGILGFGALLAYLAVVCCLAFRSEKQVTYLLPAEDSIANRSNAEGDVGGTDTQEVELRGRFGLIP